MLLTLLAVGALAVPWSSPVTQDPPPLRIKAVIPRGDATSSAVCSVVVQNIHSRSAVAWIIETLPYHELGTTIDNSLAPAASLGAGKEAPVTFPCQVGELPSLEVVTVLYDDKSMYGDRNKLVEHVIKHRLARAYGLQELSMLLRSASSATPPGRTVREQVTEMIRRSSGPAINDRVRAEAKLALSRVRLTTTQDEPETFSAVIAGVRGELQKSIRMLRAATVEDVFR